MPAETGTHPTGEPATASPPPRYRDDLHLRAGSVSAGPDPVELTPERCGWRFTGLRVIELAPGEHRDIETGELELVVLPLVGSADVDVASGSGPMHLAGRRSVFHGVTDVAYVGRDSEMRITGGAGGAKLALPMARARRRIDPWRLDAAEVPVEVRGAGRCTRQLNNFLAPGIGEADRLTAVEVLTPTGNWSSYPPHKHDTAVPGGEAELEEIYYFLIDGTDGFGAHRTYDLAEGWDVTASVASDDVFLVPSGYHGPCMASPDHAMYYLNVLAGPGAERSLAFTDDPRYAPIRDTWAAIDPDPRVPLYRAPG